MAIEGVANVAEETINPQRNVALGFGSAMITLVILCILTFTSAVGVGGWETVVYSAPGAEASDNPLPLALGMIVGKDSWLYHLLITVGLFGLVASFHGIILVAGRATFEFGRAGLFPKALGKAHPKFKTPMMALIANMLVGIIALLSGKTGEIITIACFGALSLYIISMISLLRLRETEPDLDRPYKTPLYPIFPIVALVIASVAFISMTIFNLNLAIIYFAIQGIAFGFYKLFAAKQPVTQST